MKRQRRVSAAPSRRQVLLGAGTSLALPFLPSLAPRSAWAEPAAEPRRLLVWFAPNGMLMDRFRPTIQGPGYDLPYIAEPLLPIQARASVLSGLRNIAGFNVPVEQCAHNVAVATLLTDQHVDTDAAEFDVGVSFDQVAAQAIGHETPFPSMQLATDATASGGFSNTYPYTLSWAGEATPLAPLTSARLLFDRMFGGTDPELSAEEAAIRKELRFSVLDRLQDRIESVAGRVGATDAVKLDQYLTGVRELELRIEQLEALECTAPAAPPSVLGFQAQLQTMSELMAVALSCEMTRIITFMVGPSATATTYGFLGIPSAHHTVSHHAYDPARLDDLARIQNFQVAQYAAMAQILAETPDGSGGNLLDHTALLYVGDLADPNVHSFEELPLILAGGEAAGWAQGQHRVYPAATSHSNLFLSLLDFVGVQQDTFGQFGKEAIDLTT